MQRHESAARPAATRSLVRTVSVFATVAMAIAAWAAPASAITDYPPLPWSVENVVVTEPQVDFGDGTILDFFGNPMPGHVIWLWDPDDDSFWPVLDGRLFINNAAGLCARMQIAYYASGGILLTTRNGGTVCSPDNRLNYWNVSLMPYGSNSLAYIQIRLQTVANNVATTIGSFGPVYP
jgi:hypothetical protein